VFWVSVIIAIVVGIILYWWSTRPSAEPHDNKGGARLVPDRERVGALFENPIIGHVELDREGRIVRVNTRECVLRGLDRSEIVGRTYWSLSPGEDRATVEQEIRHKLAVGENAEPVRRRYEQPDGETRTVEVTEILLRNEGEEIRGLLCSAIDITEGQKQQEEVFRTSGELKAVFQALPDMLLRLDEKGKVLDVKAGQPSDCFAKPENLLGQRLQEYLEPEEGLKVAQAINRLHRTHALLMIEFSAEVEGRQEIFEARFCPNYRSEMIVIIRRITERRRSEERLESYAQELERKNEELGFALANAREATEMKSRFLANMSHEIRTPMNGILGMTEFLLGTALNKEQHEYVSAVKGSADSLLTLINDILDISRIEAGKLRLDRIPFDLAVTVEEVASTCAIRARAKGLEFTCVAAENVPNYVVGDPNRLRQVLINLIGNAIKFTEKGRVRICSELDAEKDQTVTVRFTVEDTGIGIPREQHEKLFQSFVQGDNSTTRKYGGTGLGLAISRQLVEMMGGEIGFRSERDSGSAFFFTVLFETAPTVILPEQEGSHTPSEFGTDLEGEPVLLLSTDRGAHGPLRQFLDSWRCRPVYQDITDLSKSLESAAAKGLAFRIALVDLDSPGVNPGAIAGAIRFDKRFRDMALLALTSTPVWNQAQQLSDAGYAAYLHKPIRAGHLYEKIAQVLKRKSSASEESVVEPILALHSQVGGQQAVESAVPCVLLAEDNVINQRIALRLLEKLGLEADVVNNGKEAVHALELKAYDLVLMDCQMPEMDGYEATAEIRRRENGGRRTRICALTANAMVGDREKCLAAGMDDYISKPVSLADLKGAIARLSAQADPSEQIPA